MREDIGAGAAIVAEIVAEVNEKLPNLNPPPPLESPDQARFRLFDSISLFLKTAARRQPLVLILDDLHWADQQSLLLLWCLTRELGQARLLLVGTYRDVELSLQHPLAETLGELTRERMFQRVLLRGLSQAEVSLYLDVTTGPRPPAQLVESVLTRTDGNPLLVTEVVRLLAQEDMLSRFSEASVENNPDSTSSRASWDLRIPEGVREVIGRRLNRLSAECNEILSVASVIGREFALVQLAQLKTKRFGDRPVWRQGLVVGQNFLNHNIEMLCAVCSANWQRVL